MTSPERPLIVRLRNWIGDVTLGVPTLQRLADAGHALLLVGKPWASDLLAGHGWPVQPLAGSLRGRVSQLRALRHAASAADPGSPRRLDAVCFPTSLSSALEFRLAGLRALGYALEGRSPLLGRSVRRPTGLHELEVYWRLGSAFLNEPAPLPTRIGLRLAPQHRNAAAALRERHGVGPGFVVVCPFAGGTFEGRDKTWPGFADFVARELPAFGREIVICPGPGNEALAKTHFGGARRLGGIDLGTYAALLADAAAVISIDTGPGHMAAAVGTALVSVLGPSDPQQWRAWGPTVHLVHEERGWPSPRRVSDALTRSLA